MHSESDLKPIKLLLIEDNPLDVRLLRERLAAAPDWRFQIETADRLDRGLERLRCDRFDLVLLDLSLPDSAGGETIARLHAEVPRIPILALSAVEDQRIIAGAVQQGADDLLVKGTFKTDLLVRAIHFAIDRSRAREELAVARDSALESARLRAEFLANMSHEIRTPLNGVIGMTRLLVDTQLSVDQQEMIEIARSSAQTLLRIVNDILDFSKISAGKTVLEEADFDLALAVEGVIEIFAEQAHVKGVALDCLIESEVALLLRGDAGRLAQILTNLVGNAVKFTAHGKVTVRVGTVSEAENECILRFQVRDTGIGIPLDGQRIIFNAFTQGEDSTTRRFGGTGLGLAISAQLVELMGGSIGVESAPGGGSTFWFTVPFRPQAVTSTTSLDQVQLERVKVLIADSNPENSRLLRDHLTAWKMRCEESASSAQALAALNDAMAGGDPFEIAIIDLQSAASDGFGLAVALKQNPRLAAVRVLGIHPLGNRPASASIEAAGIRALLVRPLRQSRLCNTLIALMASPSPVAPAPAHRAQRSVKSLIPAEIRRRTRLLLVEDDLVNQQVAMRMIERIGYRADAVDNGRSALDRLAHTTYDLILMDCQMPELDGYSATREIRRREGIAQHTPVIGLTAHALAGDRDICLRAGMDDYLSKPVMPEDLAEIIDKWACAPATSAAVAAHLPASADGTDRTNATKGINETNGINGSCGADRLPVATVVDEAVLAELREYQKPGEADFLTELIGVFKDDLIVRMNQMRAGLAAIDGLQVSRAAHALKGASGELGAHRMREICSRLESSTADGSIATASSMVQELEAEAERVNAALARHCVDASGRVPALEV